MRKNPKPDVAYQVAVFTIVIGGLFLARVIVESGITISIPPTCPQAAIQPKPIPGPSPEARSRKEQELRNRLLITTEYLETMERCMAYGTPLEKCFDKDDIRTIYLLQGQNYKLLGVDYK